MPKLSIAYLPIEALVPHWNNPRTHSPRQIEQIAASIQRFGFTNPVLIDSKGQIVAGHGRVAGARLLGLSEVPTVRLEQLSDDELRAYVIADNRLAEKAGWDEELLGLEFQYLAELDIDLDLSLTGFDLPQIDVLIQGVGSVEAGVAVKAGYLVVPEKLTPEEWTRRKEAMDRVKKAGQKN